MATTTNYGWTTPDDTALVKDGAAAIRSLGTAIDTSFAADEGDLLVGGTSDIFEALPIGAAGTVLTSDGDTAEWATPAGGAQTYTLQNAGGTALTGATTITVSGLSNLNQIYVRVDAASADAGSTMTIRFNADSGSNYLWTGLQITQGTPNTMDYVSAFAGTTSITLGKMGTDSGSRSVYGTVIMSGCNATTPKPFNASGMSSGAGTSGWIVNGSYIGTSTISSVSIISDTGNFDAGTIYIYGA
jgi:hypothetical protein